MLQDLKTACRELLKSPWFTCITVLTLALGIGANTAIFGVVNRLLLNPLPYPDGDRIVYLRLGAPRTLFGRPTYAFVARQWRDEARSLDGVEVYELHDMLAYDDRGARVVHAMRITPGLPAFLGVSPALGRTFSADDAAPGAPAVALLSYRSWQRDYAGARDVLGRAVTLDGTSHVVVGVMPAGWDAFASSRTAGADVWVPLALAGYIGQSVEVVARLRPEVPIATVTSELDAIMRRASADVPLQNPSQQVPGDFSRVVRPVENVTANARDTVLVLMGAVGLMLLVACSNVANLFLARGVTRARGLALRAALGASRWRLVRAQLTECLVLALAAGAAGLAIGWLTLALLVRLRPDNLPELGDVRLDAGVLAFTFGVSVLTALLFGVAPALQVASTKLGNALRHGASGVMRADAGARIRKLLVAAQMAFSVILLVSAGLLVRSVIYLENVNVGFDTHNLLSAQLALPRARYDTPANRDVLSEQILERVAALPSVAGVTQSFIAPPRYAVTGGVLEIRGMAVSEADARASYAFNFVRPNYFATLGIRLIEGRTFTADEVRSGAAVVINRAAAQRFWPGGSAIGAEIKLFEDWATVVGVADNVVSGSLITRSDRPQFYWPFLSGRVPTFIGDTPGIVLTVRAAADPAPLIASLRAAIQALDPEIAFPSVLLTETALAGSIAGPRFNMALLTAFAAIALALAAVGLAAVIGYEVNERTHEIGVRVALGARAEDVRRLAMRHGLMPAFGGVVIGMLGALAAAKLAANLLYGVAPRDPVTFATVVVALIVVALGASWIPARRAARVDPIVALRAD
ncbi:MAG TPA: ABC transporter permease [Gammaproteobacteria bacterium]|nr:ABC transporter permease [Gammaproteobacteria bacterium]